MPTKLASLLQERVEDTSLRAVARGAGIGTGTVKRVIDGANVSTGTLEAVAGYLEMPSSEVFRLAGADEEEELDADGRLILDMLALLPNGIKRRVLREFLSKLKIELEFMNHS